MPTGYTYPIQDGTITELSEFALNCARAFGACIELRDQPISTPVPDKFEPSNYHLEQLTESLKELAELHALSEDEKIEKAFKAYEEKLNFAITRNEETQENNARLQRMLDKVLAFDVPESHQIFKNFMVEQLKMSFSTHKYEMPEKLSAEQWFKSEQERLEDEIKFQREHYERDVERARRNTEWISTLRQLIKDQS